MWIVQRTMRFLVSPVNASTQRGRLRPKFIKGGQCRAEKALILIRCSASNSPLFDHLPEEVQVRPLNNCEGDATEVPRRRLGLGEGSLDESRLRKGFQFPQHLVVSLISASTQRGRLRAKFINGGQCSFPGLPRPGGKNIDVDSMFSVKFASV